MIKVLYFLKLIIKQKCSRNYIKILGFKIKFYRTNIFDVKTTENPLSSQKKKSVIKFKMKLKQWNFAKKQN